MPEVRRGGARGLSDSALSTSTGSRMGATAAAVDDGGEAHKAASDGQLPARASVSGPSAAATEPANAETRRSLSYALRPTAEAYDSRAATRTEWRRRAKTLDEYYDDNRHLLPQLPFAWHHGRRRWRLFLFAFFVFIDASAVPIALYYGMHYAGDVEGWIIFAVVTTIWGGPTYLEFAVRTLRLIKRERFFRPLGTDSRWCFDMLTWTSVVTITAVTALFVVGSAPHVVWLRVLCMPAPAILYCLGGVLAVVTLHHQMGWPAPFRISSTAKGDKASLRVPPRLRERVADQARGTGASGRLLLCRGRRRRQRRGGPALPRGPGGAVQGQRALPAYAVPAIALLVGAGAGARGGAHGGGGGAGGAGHGGLRRVLGGAVPVVGPVGGNDVVVVQAGDGAGEARVGGRRRRRRGQGRERRGGTGGGDDLVVRRRGHACACLRTHHLRLGIPGPLGCMYASVYVCTDSITAALSTPAVSAALRGVAPLSRRVALSWLVANALHRQPG